MKITLRSLIIALFVFPAAAVAADQPAAELEAGGERVVGPGDQLEPYVFEDQFGKEQTIAPETDLVLMSFEMELSKSIHKFLEDKDPNYLAQHHAQYIADITPMPAIITWLFAGPKMRDYKFPILLADDDSFAPKYPKKEGKIVAFKLGKDRTVEKVSYYDSMEEVDKAFFQEPRVTVANMADQISQIKKKQK